jgi:LPXTG-motif cell wall-anchored protein
LECGVYYIKETQAPLGYVRLKEAIAVNVVSKTMQEVAYTYVGNERGILLPETGGFGTPLFLGIGGTLTLFAVILLVTKKRMINS